ncbi:hypothetical protein KKKH37_07440 [Helicobacter pylori]
MFKQAYDKNEMQILEILLKSIANESYIFTKITEFNQRVRYAIFKSVFGIFGLDAKRSSSDEFLEIKQVSFQSPLIKEFDFKMKPIDSKEQELINLFNLKFGRFSWENYLA